MTLGVNQADLPFELRDGLIWKKGEISDRLCIPHTCSREILELLHGKYHVGIDRLQARGFVMDWKELKRYLQSCPECAVLSR